jgi:hypothetical protein
VLTNTGEQHATLEVTMHHSTQSRRDIVEGLHQRSCLATAEFYRLIGRPEPVVAFRMMVKPLTRLPTQRASEIGELLPHNWSHL